MKSQNQNRTIDNLIIKLEEKYSLESDDLFNYLEGLALEETKGTTYWDYIEVDTLLTLQKPKTTILDENIFIVYHQICELTFSLIIQELDRIINIYMEFENDPATTKNSINLKNEIWTESLKRCIRYFYTLIASFDILKSGMDKDSFNDFRKTLTPASGFQSFQFRKIEVMITNRQCLTINDNNSNEYIYWKMAARTKSGKEHKVLTNFNEKYGRTFEDLLIKYKQLNIYYLFKNKTTQDSDLKNVLIELEKSILLWKVAHRIMVIHHMKGIKGTGGTDCVSYLNIQDDLTKTLSKRQIIYFPDLWDSNKSFSDTLRTWIDDIPENIQTMVKSIFTYN